MAGVDRQESRVEGEGWRVEGGGWRARDQRHSVACRIRVSEPGLHPGTLLVQYTTSRHYRKVNRMQVTPKPPDSSSVELLAC